MDSLNFKTKSLTLGQREELNNLFLRSDRYFSAMIFAMRCGLDELNGEKINKENFDDRVNALSSDEIGEISAKIITETNQGKKKGG